MVNINNKTYKQTERELESRAGQKRTLIRVCIAAGALLLFFVALRLLCLSTAFCELMSRTFNRAYNTALGTLSSLVFPASLYEIFIYCAAAFVIAMIVRTVWRMRRREFIRALSTILAVLVAALGLAGVYNLTAGFYYNRAEMPMSYRDASISLLDARAFAEEYVSELTGLAARLDFDDETGYVVSPYSYAELNRVIAAEYAKLDDDYFTAFTPRVKKIQSGWAMSNMHLTGVAFSPFGEANINSLTPTRSQPIVMAHEIAHIKGVMREDDANLLAYYICISSDDYYVRYCGYSYLLANVLNATRSASDKYYTELYSAVPEAVRRERVAISEFWQSYTLLADIADWFNDLYLKFNGTGGTGDYTSPGATNPSPPATPVEEQVVTLDRVQRMVFLAAHGRGME